MSREELEDLVDLGPAGRKRRRTTADSDDSEEDEDDNDVTIVENDVDMNNTKEKYCPSFSFVNTNARSLKPKLEALYDCFHEKDLDCAIVTETWLQGEREVEEVKEILEHNYSLGLHVRNRESVAANGRRYGGVGIIYRKSRSSLKPFPLTNPDEFEVIAAVGKVTGVRERICCIGCYLPPNINADRAKRNLEYISDVITEVKRQYEDCLILLAGDFNQWQPGDLLQEHPDLSEIKHGPTRGDREIDRSFVNFSRSMSEYFTISPLDTEEGNESDHKVAFGRALFPKQQMKAVTFSYMQYTQAGATGFLADLEKQDWSPVERADSTSDKVEVFQGLLDGIMSRNFKWKTTTRKPTDKPWINDKIRWLSKKSRKIYDREGRSRRWKNVKKKIAKISANRAAVFMETVKTNMTGPDACRSFFKNVRSYSCRE